MIELHDVSKHYRLKSSIKLVLDKVNIVFSPGRNMGILGRNGAGKSTLMRLIGGADVPTSGKIIRRASVSWPIGFGGGFHGSLTGRENLRFICRIYDAEIEKVTNFVDDFAELGSYMDMPIKTYSSGMKAKLAFGLSMAIDFNYYLIDETTAVGDARFIKKSKKEFDLRKSRSTLIVVSHNVGTIRQHCDSAAVLHDGHLTVYDDIEEAISRYESLN